MNSWREEVLAARTIREEIRLEPNNLISLQEPVKRVGKALHSVGLDGRALDSNGFRTPSMKEHLAVLPAIVLALLAAPLTLYGSGVMILIAKILGDNTDEGLDARTTYHFLASMLGPMIIWPIPMAIFALYAFFGPLTISALQIVLITVLLPVAFHLSNKIALLAWDLHIISRDARQINRFARNHTSEPILKDIHDLLAALK